MARSPKQRKAKGVQSRRKATELKTRSTAMELVRWKASNPSEWKEVSSNARKGAGSPKQSRDQVAQSKGKRRGKQKSKCRKASGRPRERSLRQRKGQRA